MLIQEQYYVCLLTVDFFLRCGVSCCLVDSHFGLSSVYVVVFRLCTGAYKSDQVVTHLVLLVVYGLPGLRFSSQNGHS